MLILFPNKYLNLFVRLIEKEKNENINNYKNQQFDFNSSKTSKNIHKAKVDFFQDHNNYEKNIKYSNSSSDFRKLSFPQSRIFDGEKINFKNDSEKNLDISNINTIKDNNYTRIGKEIMQQLSVKNLDSIPNNIIFRKSGEFYSSRNNNENSKNFTEKNYNENINDNNRIYTNPNLYEISKSIEKDRIYITGKENHVEFKDEKKSRPLSVNHHSSKYLERFESNNINKDNFIMKKIECDYNLVNQNNNKNHLTSNEIDFNNKNIANCQSNHLKENFYPSSIENYNDCPITNENLSKKDIYFPEAEEKKSHTRNYITINNSIKNVVSKSIPDMNFNYNSNIYNKYKNFNNNNFEINNNPDTIKHPLYKLNQKDVIIKSNFTPEFIINKNMDDIITLSDHNKKNELNSQMDNNMDKNTIIENNNHISNTGKIRYLSEKRMFRDRKDDQKNLICKIKNNKFL